MDEQDSGPPDGVVIAGKVDEALFEALVGLIGLGSSSAWKKKLRDNPELGVGLISEWERKRPAIEELCSYLGVSLRPERTFEEEITKNLDRGFDATHAVSAARAVEKAKRGAPVSVRRAAVRALELRLMNPKEWTWPKLGRMFCQYDQPPHEHSDLCTQRLRQAVRALEAVLRKHGVHPANRDKL